MSSFRRPKLSAWERDEHEGYYQAELHGWTLRTSWSPQSPRLGGERGDFGWEATREDDAGEKTLSEKSKEHFVELAAAMSAAEEFARRDELRRAYETARRAEASALAGGH